MVFILYHSVIVSDAFITRMFLIHSAILAIDIDIDIIIIINLVYM